MNPANVFFPSPSILDEVARLPPPSSGLNEAELKQLVKATQKLVKMGQAESERLNTAIIVAVDPEQQQHPLFYINSAAAISLQSCKWLADSFALKLGELNKQYRDLQSLLRAANKEMLLKSAKTTTTTADEAPAVVAAEAVESQSVTADGVPSPSVGVE